MGNTNILTDGVIMAMKRNKKDQMKLSCEALQEAIEGKSTASTEQSSAFLDMNEKIDKGTKSRVYRITTRDN